MANVATLSFFGIVFSNLLIGTIQVGHQVRLLGDKTLNQRSKFGGLITGNHRRPDLALALGSIRTPSF